MSKKSEYYLLFFKHSAEKLYIIKKILLNLCLINFNLFFKSLCFCFVFFVFLLFGTFCCVCLLGVFCVLLLFFVLFFLWFLFVCFLGVFWVGGGVIISVNQAYLRRYLHKTMHKPTM